MGPTLELYIGSISWKTQLLEISLRVKLSISLSQLTQKLDFHYHFGIIMNWLRNIRFERPKIGTQVFMKYTKYGTYVEK